VIVKAAPDTTPPTVTGPTFSKNPAYVNENVDIFCTASDSGSEIKSVIAAMTKTGSVWNNQTMTLVGGSTYKTTFTTNVPQSFAVYCVAKDNADNYAQSGPATLTFQDIPVYLPDLTIYPVDISFTPATPVEGNDVLISVNVHNIGNLTASNINLRVRDTTLDQTIGTTVIPVISSNGIQTASILWYSVSQGSHTIEAFADYTYTIAEGDESNNLANKTITISSAPLPDLSISTADITFSPSNPTEGDSVLVSATIHNIGDTWASNVNYEIIDTTLSQTIATGTIGYIDTGLQKTVSYVWNSVAKGTHTVKVTVDPTNSITEKSETNNEASKDIIVSPIIYPPVCSNFSSKPMNAIYSLGAIYRFQATCTDDAGIANVYFEFNNVNYTAERNGDDYNATFSDLAAGSYPNKWYAVDIDNLGAVFSQPNYTIAQAPTTMHLYFNGTEGDRSYYINDIANVTAVLENLPGKIITIINSGTTTGPSPLEKIVALPTAGTFAYTASFAGDQNYSASTTTHNITVLTVSDTEAPKYSNCRTNPLSPTTYASGAFYEFLCAWTDNSGTVSQVFLDFDGVNRTATKINGDWRYILNDLAVGSYPYRWFARDAAGNWNQTAMQNYTINKAPTTLRLFLNDVESNRNYNLFDVANFTAVLENLPGKTVTIISNISGFGTRTGTSPFQTNVQLLNKGIFNVTGYFLGNQNYSASSQTYFINVDGSDITPPVVNIISPQNTTYTISTFPNGFYWSVNEAINWAAYSLDGNTNVTITGNVTPPPSEAYTIGAHHLIIYAKDLAGNTGYDDVYYTVVSQDTIPPTVIILSPENITYSNNIIDLIFTVDELTSWSGYSLDGQANITSGNTTLFGLTSGSHNVAVYATDLAGNTGFDEVGFAVSCLSRLIDSHVDSVYYLNNTTNIFANSTITCSLINKTNVTISKIDVSNIYLSKIDNSTVINSNVNNCSIKDSIFKDQNCKDSTIDPSDVQRSNTTGSIITDSHVWDSNATYSNITLSTLDFCDITNSTLYNVTCRNSTIYLSNVSNSIILNSIVNNSTIENSNIHDSIVENAVIKDNVLISGCITYNGVKYCAPPSINLNDIYNPLQPPVTQPPSSGCCYGFNPWFTVAAPQSISIQQGETRSFTVMVTNTKPWYIPGISLRIDGIPASWFSVEPASQGADSEKSVSYNVTITIPENETIGERTLTLLATNGGLDAKVNMVLAITKRSVIISPILPTGALIFMTNPVTVSGIVVIVIALVLIYLYYFQREKWNVLVSFVKTIPDKSKTAYEKLKSAYYRLTGKYEIEVIEEYSQSGTKQAEIGIADHPAADNVVKFTVEYEEK
jgi:uncharacterized protein YjbI with pentapeptide repeats